MTIHTIQSNRRMYTLDREPLNKVSAKAMQEVQPVPSVPTPIVQSDIVLDCTVEEVVPEDIDDAGQLGSEEISGGPVFEQEVAVSDPKSAVLVEAPGDIAALELPPDLSTLLITQGETLASLLRRNADRTLGEIPTIGSSREKKIAKAIRTYLALTE